MLLEKTGMADRLGRENIFDNINGALERANELVK
jgi:SulP family sulfate permease